MIDCWISRHALERLREHHPGIGVRGAHELLDAARPIQRGEASGFLQRRMQDCQDHYYLAADLCGLFVVARGRGQLVTDRPWSLVTYLRLSPSQQDQALQLWGEAV